MPLSDRIFFFFFCWGDRGKRTPASPEGYCRELASLQTGFLQLCFGAGEGSAAGAAFVWVGAGAAPLALPWGAPAAPWGAPAQAALAPGLHPAPLQRSPGPALSVAVLLFGFEALFLYSGRKLEQTTLFKALLLIFLCVFMTAKRRCFLG